MVVQYEALCGHLKVIFLLNPATMKLQSTGYDFTNLRRKHLHVMPHNQPKGKKVQFKMIGVNLK